jgi:hypothetical protein
MDDLFDDPVVLALAGDREVWGDDEQGEAVDPEDRGVGWGDDEFETE